MSFLEDVREEISNTPNVCFSGGAKGADKLFGELAYKNNHAVYHWSFQNHHSPCDPNLVYEIPYTNLIMADNPLKEANKVLKRHFPTRSEYVNNLLRRNYYQVYFSNRIYATTPLDGKGIPQGGTAWAIIMATKVFPKPYIYNFDPNTETWKIFYSYHETKNVIDWHTFTPPKPSGRYAGIGSSEMQPSQIKAIEQLYA